MSLKSLWFIPILLGMCTTLCVAQTKAELEAERAELQGQVGALQGQINALTAQIDQFPGWHFGSGGVLGLNFSNFNNWFSKANPNSAATNISATFNGYANKFEDAYFWRNTGTIGLGWQKLDTDTEVDEVGENNDFEETIDFLNLQSLYGYKLSDKLAASTLGEYRTTVLSNVNNPGYLDIGVGITWTPMTELVVVAHPLNYNFVFADDDAAFKSSLGAKVIADYNRQILNGIAFRSNLTAFLSYKSADPSLHNYTWTNGLTFKAWKGIGVGIEYALRRSEQETFATGDHGQSYLIIGLSYTL